MVRTFAQHASSTQARSTQQGSPGLEHCVEEVVPERGGGREDDGNNTGKVANDREEDHDEST